MFFPNKNHYSVIIIELDGSVTTIGEYASLDEASTVAANLSDHNFNAWVKQY